MGKLLERPVPLAGPSGSFLGAACAKNSAAANAHDTMQRCASGSGFFARARRPMTCAGCDQTFFGPAAFLFWGVPAVKVRLPRALSLIAALCGAALVVTGCSTPQPVRSVKADYKEFTDATWMPERTVRPPFRSREIEVDALQAMTEGIYAFYDASRSFFQIQPESAGVWRVSETLEHTGERAFTWGVGATTLYRNGQAVPNSGRMTVETLPDGRVLLKNAGEAPFNLAVAIRAFDVSGKPIRHFLRNANNQPDDLAWFMDPEARFPSGSKAYITTYWLGDDEIVQPSSSAFTGAATLERLVAQFSAGKSPLCLSYVSHVAAQPYGVVFDNPLPAQKSRSRRRVAAQLPDSGTFSLVGVNSKSIFCEPLQQSASHSGTWTIRTVQGTRVMELTPQADVQSSDMGVQPVNAAAISVGFAEVVRPAAAATSTARARNTPRKAVVPVRIVHNNMPVVDFRLKFNPTAANAVSSAMVSAQTSRAAYESQEKARIKAQLEAGRTQPASAASQAPASSAGALTETVQPASSDPMGDFLKRR